MNDTVSDFGGRRVAVNTLWNFCGQASPLVFSLVSIPFIIDGLGIERFGVLLLIWAVIGYFGLFDFGVGRALTQMVAERLGSDMRSEIPSLVWMGLVLMLLLGAAGGLVLAGVADYLVTRVLSVPNAIRGETTTALFIVAVSLPLITMLGAMRGVLEGYQRFDLANKIRIPISALAYLSQMVAAMLWPDLVTVAAVLVTVRALGWCVHFYFCWRLVSPPPIRQAWRRDLLRHMLRFGGWMTVTNVIGPFMVYFDRFVVGTILGVAAVTYYATPYEVVTRLWIVPGAIVGVLFPAFAATINQDRQRTARLFSQGLKGNFLLLFPVTLVVAAFAQPLLAVWLGPDLAERSAPVLQLLVVGVLLNSLAQVPFALIQGAGRPDVTAKLHLLELPLYLVFLVWATQEWGIYGTALAWVARAGVDGFILGLLAGRLLPELRQRPEPYALTALAGGAALLLAALVGSITLKFLIVAVAILGFAGLGWFRILDAAERTLLLLLVRRRQ